MPTWTMGWTRTLGVAWITIIALYWLVIVSASPAQRGAETPPVTSQREEQAARLPAGMQAFWAFEQAGGAREGAFVARGRSYVAYLDSDAILIAPRAVALMPASANLSTSVVSQPIRMQFLDGQTGGPVVGLKESSARSNYLLVDRPAEYRP